MSIRNINFSWNLFLTSGMDSKETKDLLCRKIILGRYYDANNTRGMQEAEARKRNFRIYGGQDRGTRRLYIRLLPTYLRGRPVQSAHREREKAQLGFGSAPKITLNLNFLVGYLV